MILTTTNFMMLSKLVKSNVEIALCFQTTVLFLFSDSDSDTLVTADSVFNSPTQSLQDINLLASYNPLINNTSTDTENRKTIRRVSVNSSSSSSNSSDDTLNAVSMASSCDTYFSQGGDAYKCARSEFTFHSIPKMEALVDVGETSNFRSR